MTLIWMLLACDGDTRDPQLPRIRSPGADPAAITAMELPEPPFTARSRISPTTLVDERGQVLLVMEAIGVELQVERLMKDRALVRCTGCRAPLDAWVQRSTLFVGTTPGDGPYDPWLAWLNAQDQTQWAELARHGFVAQGTAFVAPPWYAEPGASGEALELSAEGTSWRVELRAPSPAPSSP